MKFLSFIIVFLLQGCALHQSFRIQTRSIIASSLQRRIQTNTFLSSTSSSTTVTKEDIKIVEPFGKGLSSDIKRKFPFYLSEFKDGFNIKTLSTSLFMFFACTAPAVAFGGLLGLATGGQMGTVETIGATAIGGVLYALFSAQPLTIIGTTGPLLAFLKVLYEGCAAQGIPFLPVYSWVGLWSAFLLLLSSFFSTSNVVEYFTRFTDDIFSSLISIIFIFEALKDLIGNFTNPAVTGLQACISLIVAFSTFFGINTLAGLRKTPYFNRQVRDKIADFAPTLGVLGGVSIASFIAGKYKCLLPMLRVPELITTTSGRSWIVDIFSVSNKIKLFCLLPALMATVLLFMDQNITVRLVMSKDNKLKKGSGLHLDMLVISAVTAITSLLGMPWMVAATVRSLAHMKSLRNYGFKSSSDIAASATGSGTTTTTAVVSEGAVVEMTGVQEQRVSGLAIHSLIGAALLFGRHLLRQLPISVLTGLFLYLGFSSIGTTDLYDRSRLFLMDDRDLPTSKSYIQEVGAKRTKIFTSIQVALLGSMWWMKGTKFGVFFPVLIGVLAPIRIALEKWGFFTKKELETLDGEIG